jgi:hypothetical protein
MKESFYQLGTCERDRTLDWSRYTYWHREIEALVKEIDKPPSGLRQFYSAGRGNRNLMNLAIFWLSGVAVLCLAIVASACAIVSVVYTKKALHLADLQLHLSLLQACNDPGITSTGLLEFCHQQELSGRW